MTIDFRQSRRHVSSTRSEVAMTSYGSGDLPGRAVSRRADRAPSRISGRAPIGRTVRLENVEAEFEGATFFVRNAYFTASDSDRHFRVAKISAALAAAGALL